MFLPVILIRDFGAGGVLAFAIPNVIGCTAFGYVLANRQRREALLRTHRPALRWFSMAAVAYNVYFIGWLLNLTATRGTPWLGAYAGGAVIVVGIVLAALPFRFWPGLAVVIYVVSLASFAGVGIDAITTIPATGARPATGVAWLAPVMAFGFLLCPVLDLTFYRALDRSPSRHAFAVFGVTFAVMLVLTCAYRDVIVLSLVPIAHIAAQTAFTAGAHLRELRATGTSQWKIVPVSLAFVALVGVLSVTGEAGERVYLRFLVLYGLIFPSYVLLFVGPGPVPAPSRRNVLIWAAAMLACLPFYELGFIHDRLWLPVIPLAAILAFRVAAGFARRTASRTGPPAPEQS